MVTEITSTVNAMNYYDAHKGMLDELTKHGYYIVGNVSLRISKSVMSWGVTEPIPITWNYTACVRRLNNNEQ